ncbi:aldehyde dehydrogenase family protein [Cellulomonas sp. KRMCY2]|uniref:aldehyde dehydrogenase family protein n=1 Tax=Cellulomonas sp. KRMCY2 TaxID=1304865 RepID=UPI00045E9574|nr:aldehyde dehydrogenase family protein [Cellulomonas sp. KRMCY2]
MLLTDPVWHGKIHSGGWRAGSGGTYSVVSPSTGEELAVGGLAAPQDVATAAARAQAAQRVWAARPHTERAAVLRRAGDLWEANAEEISGWLVRETGAVPGFAGFQVGTSAQECFEAAALASAPYGELLRSTEPRLSLSRRVPVGVVGVIAPFNVPTILAIRAVAPALVLGNAVLLKPDPRTAVSGGVLLARIFAEAGLPDGLLHVLPGGADVGEALVIERAVRVIAFTGSTRAGRAVGMLGAQHLKRVHLELGGNSALLVLDDVDVDAASSVGAWGSFCHQGQVCMASGRHLVQSGVADAYIEALAARADALPVGDPSGGQVALGPVIDAGQRDKIHAMVTGTVAAGARLAAGGTYQDLFYRPTVLADVPTSSPAYAEEVFGPVAPVTRFDTVDDAVRLASESPYGLSLGILTNDVMRAMEIAERIPTGLVHINDQTINDEANVPFGGVLDSGTGSRVGGARANLDAFTDTQWVTVRGHLPSYPM